MAVHSQYQNSGKWKKLLPIQSVPCLNFHSFPIKHESKRKNVQHDPVTFDGTNIVLLFISIIVLTFNGCSDDSRRPNQKEPAVNHSVVSAEPDSEPESVTSSKPVPDQALSDSQKQQTDPEEKVKRFTPVETPQSSETRASTAPHIPIPEPEANQRVPEDTVDQSPADPNRLLKARKKMNQILSAFYAHFNAFNMFSPNTRTSDHFDAKGRPLLSWRVHLLPFLGEETLYNRFKLDEPWDSPHNKRLLPFMPDVYRSPGDPRRSTTRFRSVESILENQQSHPATMFPIAPGGRSIDHQDISDGWHNTILFLEAGPTKAAPWTKPDGLPLNLEDPAEAFGLTSSDGVLTAFVDGVSRIVQSNTAPHVWLHLLNYADGYPIPDNIFMPLPAPHFIPRLKGPLHLAYLTEDTDGVVVIQPKAITQTKQAAQMLTAMSGDRTILPLELLQEMDQVIIWMTPRNDASWGHIAVQFTAPTTLETAAKKLDISSKKLWQHDERTWLVAPSAVVKKMVLSKYTLRPEAYLWQEMDLNHHVSGRFISKQNSYLSDVEKAPLLNSLSSMEQIDVVWDFSGEALLSLDIQKSSSPNSLKFGSHHIQGIVQSMLSQNITPELKPTIEAMKKQLTITEDKIDKDWTAVKLKHSTEFASVYSHIFSSTIKPAVTAAIKSKRYIQQAKNLNYIGQAFLHFEDDFGHFPAYSKTLFQSKPLLSWRVQLLPYLGQGRLYEKFKLDEPWDSPHNKKLLHQMPKIYLTEGVNRPGWTSFTTFSGQETLFPPGSSLGLQQVSDNPFETILCLIASADKAVPWTQPVDLEFNPANPARVLGELPDGATPGYFLDGSTRWIEAGISAQELRTLIRPNDKWRALISGKGPRSKKWETPSQWALLMALSIKDPFEKAMMLNDLATIHIEAGDPKTAQAILKQGITVGQMIDLEHLRTMVFKSIALSLVKLGSVQRAIELVQETADENQRDFAFKGLIITLAQIGDLKEAIEMVQNITSLENQVSALTMIAMTLFEQKDREQALSVLKQALIEFQKIKDPIIKRKVLSVFSQTLVNITEIEQVEIFVNEMEHADSRDYVLYRLVVHLVEVGNLKQALQSIQNVKNSEKKVFVLCSIAQSFFEEGDKVQANTIVKQALEISQKMGDPKKKQSALGITSMTLGNIGQTKQALELAQKIQTPAFKARALDNIAFALTKSGKGSQAIELAYTIEKQEMKMEALENIARAYVESGNVQQALEVLQRIENREWDPTILNKIAQTLIDEGEFEQALDIAYEIKNFKDEAAYLSNIVQILVADGDTKQALEVLQRIENREWDPTILNKIAQTLIDEGELEQALDIAYEIKNPTDEAAYLSNIVQILATDGGIKQALEVAEKISLPEEKAIAFSQISTIPAKAGNEKLALEIVEKIEDQEIKVSTLLDLYSILSEAGSQEQSLTVLRRAMHAAQVDKNVSAFQAGVTLLALEPKSKSEQEDPGAKVVRRMKKEFTPAEKKLADQLLQVIQGIQ